MNTKRISIIILPIIFFIGTGFLIERGIVDSDQDPVQSPEAPVSTAPVIPAAPPSIPAEIISRRIGPPKPTPTDLTITDWVTYNHTSPIDSQMSTVFSLEIPYVGMFCNGCFGGMSMLEYEVQGSNSISGGHDDPTSTNARWRLWMNAQETGARPESDVISDEQYARWVASEVGDQLEKIEFSSEETMMTITEKQRKTIENVPVTLITTTDPDGQLTYQAFFAREGFHHHILFESYDPQFDQSTWLRIIGSLSFSLYEDPFYGEPWIFAHRRSMGDTVDYVEIPPDERQRIIEEN